MKNNNFHHPLFIVVLSALAIAQLACMTVMGLFQTPMPSPPTATRVIIYVTATPLPASATQAASPTPSLDNFSDDDIKAGIQSALDLYAQAYNENNPDLLTQMVDQENKPFRRLVRSRFDDFQKSSSAGNFQFDFELLGIQRRELGYVIAHLRLVGGNAADWPFRYLNGQWVLTEPTVDQIGAPVITDKEHFTFTTYPWADDVNPRIMEMMETARAQVEATLGVAPKEKAHVNIWPIYGLDPFTTSHAIAWYSSGDDTITIYTPNSFTYYFYDADLGWDGTLQKTLTHEYTHMAHARNFDGAGRLADWMTEGLAEYVSDAPGNVEWACYNLKNDNNIPILDESGAAAKQDLMHMSYLQKDTDLAYAYSHALVKFTVTEFDGMDGFWKLARSIDETGDFKKAVKATFGIDYEEFNKLWLKWLKRQC